MNALVRYYNQNRKSIWFVIMVIVFVIVIIQVLNSFYAQKSEEEKNEVSTNTQAKANKVEERSEAMVQGSITSQNKKEDYVKIIEQFLDYCCNNQPEKAYQLLSSACKEKLYPTQKSFETGYYNLKFNEKKTYDFQLWSAINKTYIYLVKIYDDMLSTGLVSTNNYIQDYYSVIEEDNVYKLSIGSYIKNTNYQSSDEENIGEGSKNTVSAEVDNISIFVTDRDSYMDYEIYHILVANNSEQDILLDSSLDDDTVVVVDENGNEFNAMLMELTQDDLIIEKGSSKNIDIKFSRSYVSNIEVQRMKFKKVIKNYEQFMQNVNTYEDFVEIKIDLK